VEVRPSARLEDNELFTPPAWFSELLTRPQEIGLPHARREREARVTYGRPGLPSIAGRGVVGAPGSSRLLAIRPAPPDVTRLPRRRSSRSDRCAKGPDGSGRAAGWTLGGRLRTMRASLSRTQPRPQPRVARQPPGALAERSGSERVAGASGGASGPCRPGLKRYREFSPPEIAGMSDPS
jgi:hypothetical protein